MGYSESTEADIQWGEAVDQDNKALYLFTQQIGCRCYTVL